MPTGTWSDPYLISGATGSVSVPDGEQAVYKWTGSGSDFTRAMGMVLTDGVDPNLTWQAYDDKGAGDYGTYTVGYSSNPTSSRVPYDGDFYLWATALGAGGRTLSWSLGTTLPARPYSWEAAQDITTEMLTNGSMSYDNAGPSYGTRVYKFTPVDGTTVTLSPAGFRDDNDYGEIYDNTGSLGAYQNYVGDFYQWVGHPDQQYSLSVPATGGPHEYYVVIYPTGPDDSTTWSFSWVTEPAPPPPAYVVSNDPFASPISLPDPVTAGSITYDNTGATMDSAYQVLGLAKERSIWYQITPTATGIVTYTATASDAVLARHPVVEIWAQDSGGTWYNYGQWPDNSNRTRVQYKTTAGVPYRVVLAFPEGNAGIWETNGTLSWGALVVTPTNVSVATATPLAQTALVTLPAYAGSQTYVYTLTVPTSGGFMVVLGDGITAAPSGVSGSASVLGSDGVTLTDTGTVGWAVGDTTVQRYVRQSVAGDQIVVSVSAYGWTGGSIPIRWGVSTTINWITGWLSGWSLPARSPLPYPEYQPVQAFADSNGGYFSTNDPFTEGDQASGSASEHATGTGRTDPQRIYVESFPGQITDAIAGVDLVKSASRGQVGYNGGALSGPGAPFGTWSYINDFTYYRTWFGGRVITKEPSVYVGYGAPLVGVKWVAPAAHLQAGLIPGVTLAELPKLAVEYLNNAPIQVQWVSGPGYMDAWMRSRAIGPGALFGPNHYEDMGANSLVLFDRSLAGSPAAERDAWGGSGGTVLRSIAGGDWVPVTGAPGEYTYTWDGQPVVTGERFDWASGIYMSYTVGLATGDQLGAGPDNTVQDALVLLGYTSEGFGVNSLNFELLANWGIQFYPSLWVPDYRLGRYADDYGPLGPAVGVYPPGALIDPNPDLDGNGLGVDVNFA